MINNTELKITEEQLIKKLVELVDLTNIKIYASYGFADDLDTWSVEYWSVQSIDLVGEEYVIIVHQADEYLPTVHEFTLIADKIDIDC